MEGCEVIFELVFVTDLDILNPCSFTFWGWQQSGFGCLSHVTTDGEGEKGETMSACQNLALVLNPDMSSTAHIDLLYIWDGFRIRVSITCWD